MLTGVDNNCYFTENYHFHTSVLICFESMRWGDEDGLDKSFYPLFFSGLFSFRGFILLLSLGQQGLLSKCYLKCILIHLRSLYS